jgi:hypothetical protein
LCGNLLPPFLFFRTKKTKNRRHTKRKHFFYSIPASSCTSK